MTPLRTRLLNRDFSDPAVDTVVSPFWLRRGNGLVALPIPINPMPPVGLFHVQYNYANSTMQWGFSIAKQWQTEAGSNPVDFEYHIYTRGKEVNNYRPHSEPASYLFHSSIGSSF